MEAGGREPVLVYFRIQQGVQPYPAALIVQHIIAAMVNEQHRMDTMTNNLANASTVGFKKEGATSQCFSDVLTVKIKDRSDGHPVLFVDHGGISRV